jgi:hypothetical protein
MNVADANDWYKIKYREPRPPNGQPLNVTTLSMEREFALSFIAQIMAKKYEITGILKNQIELDAASVELMKNQSRIPNGNTNEFNMKEKQDPMGTSWMKIIATQEIVMTYGNGLGQVSYRKWNLKEHHLEGPATLINKEELEILSRTEYISNELPDI